MVQRGRRSIILLLVLAFLSARVNANSNARNFLQTYSNEWLQGVPIVLALLGIILGSLATAGAPVLLMMLKMGMILVTLPALLQTNEVTNSEPEFPSSQAEPEPTTTMPPRFHTHSIGFHNGISYLMKRILRQGELFTPQLFSHSTRA